MKKHFFGIIFTSIIICPEISWACNQLTVAIGGTLASDAQIVYSVKADMLSFDDAPVIRVPLDDIAGEESVLMLRLTRTNRDVWRIDIYNDLKSDATIQSTSFQGPFSQVAFDSDGHQELPVTLSFLPISKDNEVANTTVELVVKDLSIAKGQSELKILSSKKDSVECSKYPKIVYFKNKPNDEHDELNPIVGEEAYEAYLK